MLKAISLPIHVIVILILAGSVLIFLLFFYGKISTKIFPSFFELGNKTGEELNKTSQSLTNIACKYVDLEEAKEKAIEYIKEKLGDEYTSFSASCTIKYEKGYIACDVEACTSFEHSECDEKKVILDCYLNLIKIE